VAVLLDFDASSHTYRIAGRVVQSVTQILGCAASFGFVTQEQLEAAQRRGTYVHQLCELSDLGELDDEAECTGEHWPRLLAWRQFCADYGANWSAIETLGYSQLFDFAGTVDRRGKLERSKTPNDLWVIDIKTGATVSRTWGPQTAAYKQIAIEEHPRWAMARRATVRLLENGTYKFDEFKDPTDWTVFQAMNTLSHWSNSP
jgi:hypothetical protein